MTNLLHSILLHLFLGNNYALNKEAFQSSTRDESYASLAIDNNLDGNYFDGKSTSRTRIEENPWWAVDLGKRYEVRYVEIVNRDDCCGKWEGRYYFFSA